MPACARQEIVLAEVGVYHVWTRCVRRSFLWLEDYLRLLDWTRRQLVAGKRGSIPQHFAAILDRLGIRRGMWLDLVTKFDRLFGHVVTWSGGRSSAWRVRPVRGGGGTAAGPSAVTPSADGSFESGLGAFLTVHLLACAGDLRCAGMKWLIDGADGRSAANSHATLRENLAAIPAELVRCAHPRKVACLKFSTRCRAAGP